MTIEFRSAVGETQAWSRRVDRKWLREQMTQERIVAVTLPDGEVVLMRAVGGRIEQTSAIPPEVAR